MLKRILNLMKYQDVQDPKAPEDERPVKFVEERKNVWKVVYAEGPAGKP